MSSKAEALFGLLVALITDPLAVLLLFDCWLREAAWEYEREGER